MCSFPLHLSQFAGFFAVSLRASLAQFTRRRCVSPAPSFGPFSALNARYRVAVGALKLAENDARGTHSHPTKTLETLGAPVFRPNLSRTLSRTPSHLTHPPHLLNWGHAITRYAKSSVCPVPYPGELFRFPRCFLGLSQPSQPIREHFQSSVSLSITPPLLVYFFTQVG